MNGFEEGKDFNGREEMFLLLCYIHLSDSLKKVNTWKGGFPGGASGKEHARQYQRLKRCRLDLRLGRSPGGGNGNSLQHSQNANLQFTVQRLWSGLEGRAVREDNPLRVRPGNSKELAALSCLSEFLPSCGDAGLSLCSSTWSIVSMPLSFKFLKYYLFGCTVS